MDYSLMRRPDLQLQWGAILKARGQDLQGRVLEKENPRGPREAARRPNHSF